MKKILIFCCLFFIPLNVFAVENSDNLIKNASSGILIDALSGKVIYEKNMHKKASVASMTKMVAQIIIMEKIEDGSIKWDDIVTVSKNAANMGGSQIYIEEGEKITVEDLMKGISMASGNDATVQMAEVISGSESKFVKLMNKKVKELGLKNTNFVNCTGLDDNNHYSSAYDMAIIARELIVNHPDIVNFSSLYEDYLRENTDNKFWLVNTNKLVRFYDGADGLKTGHTDAAGYCLAATAKRNGLRLIAVVLGEKNGSIRNNETMELLDYGFNNTRFNILKNRGDVVKKIKLDKANKDIIEIVLKDNLGVVEELGEKNDYSYKIDINNIKLPINKGEVVGNMYVYNNNNNIVSKVKLTILEDVNKLNFFNLYRNSLYSIINGNY